MQKWQRTLRPYIYDPELGDPDNGIAPPRTELRTRRASHVQSSTR